jgi:hypothetical protein
VELPSLWRWNSRWERKQWKQRSIAEHGLGRCSMKVEVVSQPAMLRSSSFRL